jgi:peptidoglycan/LPS O-acetylase OafA/YrhL
MARAAAILIVGVLLLIAIVYLASKLSDGLKGQSGTVWRIVILIAIAAIGFWFFGKGMVFEYLNE